MECASRFDLDSKSIIFGEGKRVLANIGEQAIEETFNIPQSKGMTVVMVDQAAKSFQGNQEAYFSHLKRNWIHKERKGVNKSTRLTVADFKPEYGDLIVLLSRIMGLAQAMQFENWMYFFIDEIEKGKGKFDWARIISENLELQLRTVQNQRQFYMGSYLFYLIARLYESPGLRALGEIGNGPGQYLVHECYPQLHLYNNKDYKMFCDAFAMKTVRVLQGAPAKRLSSEAEARIKKFGSWFIQFPQFTYIRVAGSTVCPKRLPRYPPDKVVLMELARQLEHYDRIMRNEGKIGVSFSIIIGNDSCPNRATFEAAEKELEWYHLGWYGARQGFDPVGLIKASHGSEFKHVPTIEDFWANAKDDFHVRKLAFSRLSVNMMRDIRWRGLDIPDQLEDDRNVLREDYETVVGTELNPVDWDDHQDPSLEAVTRTVDLHTESWYNAKLRKLQRQKVLLTYEMMKPKEGLAESIGQKGEGSGRQSKTVRNSKKRALEVEKSQERLEPPAKRQRAAPSRESITKARSQEVNSSDKGAAVEVRSDSESSGYSESTEYSPLSENQQGNMAETSREKDGPIDIEEISQASKAVGDALLVEPNPDLGRCTAPLWLRQMLMPRGEVVMAHTVDDIQGLIEKGDSENQKQMANTVARVIRSDSDGHRRVQIAIPTVNKAADEIAAQEYEIVEHNLGRNTDDMECEEVQEGIASIRERLRKANEKIVKLEAENKYWRDCQPIQQLHQAALPQDSGSNSEEVSAQLHEVRGWIYDTIQDGRNFLPSFISTFQSLVTVRNKFRLFEEEWKNFLPIKDLVIPRLQTFIRLPEAYLERARLVDERGLSIVESWYVALTTRFRTLEEIHDEIAQHGPSVDTSILTMMSDVGVALDFEDIREEDVSKTGFGLRLDELGKATVKRKHLNTLSSLNAFIGFAKEYEKDHERILQAANSVAKSAELRAKHTPCPPMEEVNERLAKFIALAKRTKEKGRIILEDHLM